MDLENSQSISSAPTESKRYQKMSHRKHRGRRSLEFLLLLSLIVPTDAFSISRIRRQPTTKQNMVPESIHAFQDLWHMFQSHDFLAAVPQAPELPFQEIGQDLFKALDIGSGLSRDKIPEKETTIVLESIGFDFLIFLAASVLVTPLSKTIGITPILGYLIAGAVLGPYGLDIFANSRADVELGDFGILFLLFSEGLDVSSERLKQLSNFLPLGIAQISLVTLVVSVTLISGIPQYVDNFVPLDTALLQINSPLEAIVLGLTGALSTSAFIFPVLKEKGWDEETCGQASTSILLLQDLMVAPLLVILPYLATPSATDWAAIGFLTAKATIGFGTVMYVGSFILRYLFNLISAAQSSETFVALCLLVSVGMGVIARSLGLTDTAGAFGAGVLLANTNYRAQIQADILPFKGILLGIFFMGAGSNFDVQLVLAKWPTILAGSFALIFLKTVTLAAATRVPKWIEPNRLPKIDAVRTVLLLAGGGEFAFVVLALAEKLKILPQDLGSILTAVILITMGITPLLGDLAESFSAKMADDGDEPKPAVDYPPVAHDAIVVCGYGDVGQRLLRILTETRGLLFQEDFEHPNVPHIVAFDNDPRLINSEKRPARDSIVLYGNGSNGDVIRSSGIGRPTAIFVSYKEFGNRFSAISRLRASFPLTPIYTRASTRSEAQALRSAGATETVVEGDELALSAASLLRGNYCAETIFEYETEEQLRQAAAKAAGIAPAEVKELLQLYKSMDQDKSGIISATQVERILEKSSNWIANDQEIKEFDEYLERTLARVKDLKFVDFCRLYASSPFKQAFGVSAAKLEESS